MPMAFSGLVPQLRVRDMVRSIAFYRGLLGFDLVSHAPEIESVDGARFSWCWLRNGAAELMLEMEPPPDGDGDAGAPLPPPSPEVVTAHGDLCLYFACEDVDSAHAGLAGHGMVLPIPVVSPYGMKQLFLTDPDGWALCLQAPA